MQMAYMHITWRCSFSKGQCIVNTYLKENVKRNKMLVSFVFYKYSNSNKHTSTAIHIWNSSKSWLLKSCDVHVKQASEQWIKQRLIVSRHEKPNWPQSQRTALKKIEAEIQINMATYTKIFGIYLSAHFRQQVTVKLQKQTNYEDEEVSRRNKDRHMYVCSRGKKWLT